MRRKRFRVPYPVRLHITVIVGVLLLVLLFAWTQQLFGPWPLSVNRDMMP